jgi:hypothetical protein
MYWKELLAVVGLFLKLDAISFGGPAASIALIDAMAAVIALPLAVSLALFCSAIVDVWTVILLGSGLVALLRFRIDTWWLVLSPYGAKQN